MVYDLHTHTFLSDGVLSPLEMVRRAAVRGYRAIALTDHAGLATLERVVEALVGECEVAGREWGVLAVPGVELTHVPRRLIPRAARRAKEVGARLVVVHGETVVEPVEEGTNREALECPEVDILAHPGLLSEEEAEVAARRGAYLEVSARRGHCLTNGHLVRVARGAGALLVVDSDAHGPEDLLTEALARTVALGAGLDAGEAERALRYNPLALLRSLGYPLPEEGERP